MSLQTPSEAKQNPFKPQTGVPPLSNEQTKAAVDNLYSKDILNYPAVERSYADPPLVNQVYVLVSFVPSRQATPDDEGCYGCVKVRGVFARLDEADERAEYIVKNVDSENSILTAFVGRPFPLIASDGERYGAALRKIDVKQTVEKTIDADVKAKRVKDNKEMAEIKKREDRLKQDVKRDVADIPSDEVYTTLRVKRSQLIYTYLENVKKMEELQNLIRTTNAEIQVMDSTSSEFKKAYMQQYIDARKESGFKDGEQPTTGFMRFLNDDTDIEQIFKNPKKFTT